MNCPGSSHSAYLPIITSQYPPLKLTILVLAAYQSPRLVNSEIFSQFRKRANEELDLEQNVKERDDSTARELLVIAHLLSEPLHTWRSTMADRLAAMDALARQCTLLETFKRVSWWALLRFGELISNCSLYKQSGTTKRKG